MKKILIFILFTTYLVSFGYAQSMMRVGAQLTKGDKKLALGALLTAIWVSVLAENIFTESKK